MVAQAALVLWIVISAGMFALISPLRAFLLTYVIGYLFLPVEVGSDTNFVGSIYITQSLRIDKLTACNIGALIGTLVFASDVLKRFRWSWVDGVFGSILASAFVTSVITATGAKDGFSHVVETVRLYLPLMILSRIYICGPAELLEAVRAVIGGAFVYAFLCVAEWRLSPQTHRLVYGYFQHAFDEFMRYGHFRPVGFLHHAIEASFFLGTSAALTGWLAFKRLLSPLWGIVPPWGVVAVLTVGTVSTMTYSGIGAFAACVTVFFLLATWPSRWWLVVLPAFAVVWMMGRFTGTIDASLLMRTTNSMDPARSESLAYRLESERLHLAALSHNLLFGKGAANGVVRSEDGNLVKAVDAYWLITLVFYGLVGLATRYIFWGAGIVEAFRRWRDLSPDVEALAAGVGVLWGAEFVDFLFNAFPSPFLLICGMGVVTIAQSAAKERTWQETRMSVEARPTSSEIDDLEWMGGPAT